MIDKLTLKSGNTGKVVGQLFRSAGLPYLTLLRLRSIFALTFPSMTAYSVPECEKAGSGMKKRLVFSGSGTDQYVSCTIIALALDSTTGTKYTSF